MGIPELEVESWVVCAIGKKLLEARIDQLRHTVTVTRAAHRCFGTDQWQELHAQLSAWAVRPPSKAQRLLSNYCIESVSLILSSQKASL